MKNKIGYIFVGLLSAAIIALFLAYGFFIEQPCNGIDIDSLWCAMHPLKWNDILGSIIGIAAALWFTGIGLVFGFTDLYSPEGSTSGNYIALCAFVPAIVLIAL